MSASRMINYSNRVQTIASDILEEYDGCKIPQSALVDYALKYDEDKDTIGNCILDMGIEDGWLLDEYFA